MIIVTIKNTDYQFLMLSKDFSLHYLMYKKSAHP